MTIGFDQCQILKWGLQSLVAVKRKKGGKSFGQMGFVRQIDVWT
jgi:hypothetical protein